ncbi:MAG: hypothetical protein JST00_08185 [Deltaproteobacteria bacterium]|nr:hypothetical protein [Deltaproteobacteria bacterium]
MDSDDLVSLLGCAVARDSFPDLGLSDPLAANVAARLELDPGMFDERSLRAAAVRTMVVDGIVRQFFQRHPDGIAVSLQSALCTRFSRIDNGELRWIEIDEPEIARLKSMVVSPPGSRDERHVIATCCCVARGAWMSLLAEARDVPTLIVAQRSLSRMAPSERDDFLVRASLRFPVGTEMILEHEATPPFRPALHLGRALFTGKDYMLVSIGGGRDRRLSDRHEREDARVLEAERYLFEGFRVALRGDRARRASSLEIRTSEEGWTRFPRIRYVPVDEYGDRLEYELAGLDCVARLFRGRGFPTVAHLRLT